MSKLKTHYRKVFKSDHLGSADLEEMLEEGKELIFTIKHVKQEYNAKVAGKKIDANIAYFKENIKPLVLNATNSKQVAKFSGSKFVEDWSGLTIELYIDKNVRMKGEVVGGVRIKSELPRAKVLPMTKELDLLVSNCKTESELKEIWVKNFAYHKTEAFKDAVNKQKSHLVAKGRLLTMIENSTDKEKLERLNDNAINFGLKDVYDAKMEALCNQ